MHQIDVTTRHCEPKQKSSINVYSESTVKIPYSAEASITFELQSLSSFVLTCFKVLSYISSLSYKNTRMWANAQRDGRPAEYRWRPLFNAAKFGRRSLLECRAVTLPRRETRWNLQGWPKLANRSQPLVGRSSSYYLFIFILFIYYHDIWRRYCCLISFFRLSIHA